MRRLSIGVVLACVMLPATALGDPARIPAGTAMAPTAPTTPRLEGVLEARRAKMVAGLKPGMRARLDGPIQDVLRSAQPVPGKPAPDLMAVSRSSLAVLGNMAGADIEALAFLVLMEATKSAQDDLKAIMAEVKAINARKSALRAALAALTASRASQKPCLTLDCLDAVPASAEFTKGDLEAVKQTLAPVPEPQRDAKLSELHGQSQIRVQILEERRQKMSEALSRLMKKISDTSSSTTSNMK
ncbi:MAG TPA: hypothetical protein VLT33_26440 [Labilithrix sp.]|nr:hypothetical protein [Labilithrix sp.]